MDMNNYDCIRSNDYVPTVFWIVHMEQGVEGSSRSLFLHIGRRVLSLPLLTWMHFNGNVSTPIMACEMN